MCAPFLLKQYHQHDAYIWMKLDFGEIANTIAKSCKSSPTSKG